jgi:hypothetical protein
MAKIERIEARDLPLIVANYYDKGPSVKRLIGAKKSTKYIKKHPTITYIVTHTFGTDWWRQNKWGDWNLWKTTDPDSVYREII